jgi:hypothetical protein
MASVTITAEARETNRVDFTWTDERDHHATCGKRFVLRSVAIPKGAASPLCNDDRVAVCSHQGGRKWIATFWLGYDALHFHGGTAKSAMAHLERELCKRSIGLFGVDDVAFSHS